MQILLMHWIHRIGNTAQRCRSYFFGSNLATYFRLSLTQRLTGFFVCTLVTDILPLTIHETDNHCRSEYKVRTRSHNARKYTTYQQKCPLGPTPCTLIRFRNRPPRSRTMSTMCVAISGLSIRRAAI